MTVVMGVLNVTPDSFSDGGEFAEPEIAIARGAELARLGADIIDVGGESTRPGATRVSAREELARVLPVLQGLAPSGLTVSIDTLRASTAYAAITAGAAMVNDVSGGLADPEMFSAIAEAVRPDGSSAEVVLGHWRGIPDPLQSRSNYDDVVLEVRNELAARVALAVEAGIAAERIIIDPGLGFDKTPEQGWSLLASAQELAGPGIRVLIGASRKRMLAELTPISVSQGPTYSRATVHDLDLATSVVSALAARAGVWGVRVHDVPSTVRALCVAQAWTIGEHSNVAQRAERK